MKNLTKNVFFVVVVLSVIFLSSSKSNAIEEPFRHPDKLKYVSEEFGKSESMDVVYHFTNVVNENGDAFSTGTPSRSSRSSSMPSSREVPPERTTLVRASPSGREIK